MVIYDAAIGSTLSMGFTTYLTGALNLTGTVPSFVGYEVDSGGQANVASAIGFKSEVQNLPEKIGLISSLLEKHRTTSKQYHLRRFNQRFLQSPYGERRPHCLPDHLQHRYCDDEGNEIQVEKQEYIGASESLLDIIRELRQANQDLEARIAALEGA